MEQVRREIRTRRYSLRTETAYMSWIKRYILFHNKTHPKYLKQEHIRAYLNHLALVKKVSPSTQNQALAAILFLYKHTLNIQLPWIDKVIKAKTSTKLPVVFTRQEVAAVLNQLEGVFWLMASMLYGSGLRLMECTTLRVKDIDFQQQQITVRDAKWNKDRVTVLASNLITPLEAHLQLVKIGFDRDCAIGLGMGTRDDNTLESFSSSGGYIWPNQYVFPGTRKASDEECEKVLREHFSAQRLRRAIKQAVRSANIDKDATCHTFRHTFATHLLQDGYNIREVQELLGHKDVTTTMLYTHVDSCHSDVISPIDNLGL